jgi:hypothetical protein
METKTGTFLVTHGDEGAATLTDVSDRQVHALAEQADPPLEQGEVLTATLESAGDIDVAWRLRAVEDRRSIPVEESPEPPTKQERDIATEQGVGELTRRERAGDGEIHVVTVPEETTEQAVADVREDPETVARAARLGVDRVEIRAADGVVSVRYLPN